ncbi:MAG TPA: hypothetical protein VFT51_12955 [Bacillales bacterium]|nr:hypothetical protein [Bacillales bacterium]
MRRVYYGLLTCLIIILIGAVPAMFQDGIHLSVQFYFQNVWHNFSRLLTPWEITYHPNIAIGRTLFPNYWDPYLYTLFIFFTSLFSAFIFSLLLTYFTLFLRQKSIKRIQFVLSLLEAVPDIFVIVVFQVIVIWIFEETGILVFSIVAYDTIYFLPIVCLALFPSVLYYRVMLLAFEEELGQPYVDFAKGGGMTKRFIILVHVLRNSLISIFNHSKYIIWFALSNYVMIAVIFNMHGVIWFVMENRTPTIITVTLLFLFLPIYILLSLVGVTIEKITGQKAALR